MVQRKMPRVAKVALPILRAGFPDWEEFQIGTWGEDIDLRKFPMINVRSVGGLPHATEPDLLNFPVIEMTVYSDEDVETSEELYMDAFKILSDAVKRQTQTPAGYFHSIKTNMGMTQFSSPFMDSWRTQGLIRLGVRPPR